MDSICFPSYNHNLFRIAVLEKTLESPLDSKEIKPINPKGNQSWIFIGRTDAEAPTSWPPDSKNWLIGKDPDAGKDWRQKGKTEDEVEWHHWLDGYESEQAPGVGDGQGVLVCCSPWGWKESDTTEQLSNNNKNKIVKGSLRDRLGINHYSSNFMIQSVCLFLILKSK